MPDIQNLNRHHFKDTKTHEVAEKIENPVATVKHDGAAYFLHITRKNTPEYISRRLSVKGHHLDRTSKLPHLADFETPEFRGSTFHVELIHTGKSKSGKDNHPAVSGILNSLAPKAIQTQKQTGPVRAVLLDVTNPKFKTFQEKRDYMKRFAEAVNKPDLLYLPETKIGTEGAKELAEKTRKRGDEGIIITSLTKPEPENPRYKLKHYNTYNLKVTGIQQEIDKHGNPKESAGAIHVSDATDKEVATVGTGFSRELRKEIYRNPHKWINREINVKALPPTARRLRAPVFNGDSDGRLDTI